MLTKYEISNWVKTWINRHLRSGVSLSNAIIKIGDIVGLSGDLVFMASNGIMSERTLEILSNYTEGIQANNQALQGVTELEEFEGPEEAKDARPYKAPGPGRTLLSIEDFTLLLERSGMNVSQFARQLGVTRQTIYNLKYGKRSMTKRLDNRIRERFREYL